MLLTHTDCGGRLEPEEHKRWVMSVAAEKTTPEPVLVDELETLHRCDRCDQVGVITNE